MESEITVSNLSSVLKNEQKTGEISSLAPDFYMNIRSKIKNIEVNSDEYKNLSKLMNAIKEKRIQKLLVYIAYNKDVPKPLPAEEEDLYIQIKKILTDSSPEQKHVRIKITHSIPQIVTSTGSKIGPFEQNEIIRTDNISDVKYLVENKIGELIE
jgi:DNA replication initiation complex subunit (GINS family)